MSNATHDSLLARFGQDGADAGRAAGSWVVDGNTDEQTARRILQGIADGDPEIMDMAPAPLSGEWADGLTIGDVLGAHDVEQDDDAADDYLQAFEDGFLQGFWDEVERSARAMLGFAGPTELARWDACQSPILTVEDPSQPLTCSVRFDRWDGDRAQYGYKVAAGLEGEVIVGFDLRSGAWGERPGLSASMLGTLLTFLSAAAESSEGSDNWHLFGAGIQSTLSTIGADTFALLAEDVEVQS